MALLFRVQNPLYVTIPAICAPTVQQEVWMARTSKAFLNGMGIAELFSENDDTGGRSFVGHMAESYKQDFADAYATMGVEVRMVKIALEGVVIYYSDNALLKCDCMKAIGVGCGMVDIVGSSSKK